MTEPNEKNDPPPGAQIAEIIRLDIKGENQMVFDIQTRADAVLISANAVGESSVLNPTQGKLVPYLVFSSEWDKPPVRRRIALVPAGGWIDRDADLLGSFELVDPGNRITPWAGTPVLIYEIPIPKEEVVQGPDVMAAILAARDANDPVDPEATGADEEKVTP